MKLSLSTMYGSQRLAPRLTELEEARVRLLEAASRLLRADLYPFLPPDLPTTRDLEALS